MPGAPGFAFLRTQCELALHPLEEPSEHEAVLRALVVGAVAGDDLREAVVVAQGPPEDLLEDRVLVLVHDQPRVLSEVSPVRLRSVHLLDLVVALPSRIRHSIALRAANCDGGIGEGKVRQDTRGADFIKR